MSGLVAEIRLALFMWFLGLIIHLVPKSAQKTLIWLSEMPLEDV